MSYTAGVFCSEDAARLVLWDVVVDKVSRVCDALVVGQITGACIPASVIAAEWLRWLQVQPGAPVDFQAATVHLQTGCRHSPPAVAPDGTRWAGSSVWHCWAVVDYADGRRWCFDVGGAASAESARRTEGLPLTTPRLVAGESAAGTGQPRQAIADNYRLVVAYETGGVDAFWAAARAALGGYTPVLAPQQIARLAELGHLASTDPCLIGVLRNLLP